MSNATEYQHEHSAGKWQTSSIMRRCSHYFGTYPNCKVIIPKGAEFFDTEESTHHTDLRRGSHMIVCANCANNHPIPKAVRRSA